MKYRYHASPLLGILLVGLLSAATEETPMLLCSTTQVADFTRQVVGDQCRVQCILGPGVNPHGYTPVPNDAKATANADLCLQNGLHLEGKNWMATLAQDAGKPLVTCTKGIPPLELDYEGTKVNDPHAWFSPKNAAVYVNNITRAVCQLDPKNKDQYQARAKLYLQQLRTLDAWIREVCNVVPRQKRILVTTHDAFNYFCKEYGFQNKAPMGWSTGAEIGGGMTPERKKMVIDSIRSFGVKAIFVETSVSHKTTLEIAKEAGVIIGGELYSDAMGKVGSAGETYIGMMRENVLTILSALQ